MRIGVNALYVLPGHVGGTEIYLRSLLAALASVDSENDYLVYVNLETDAGLVPRTTRFRLVRCHVRASCRVLRIAYEQLALPLHLARDRADIVFNPGYTSPLLSPCPSITVFHDLQHKRHPEFFRWIDLPFWNFFLWLSARRSRSLIAVSEATARDLARYYPFAAGKLLVIRHGVDPEFFEIAARRAGRELSGHILAVSTTHPHKNLERLLRAFRRLNESRPHLRLLITGARGLAARRLETCTRELQLVDSVSFTGWLPRADLYRLFETADAVIAPSLFEGFGMPVVEALAAGIPTAVSSIPALEEIAGDAALRFDPFSLDSIVLALSYLTADQDFRTLAERRGPERASAFSWTTTASETLREFERVSDSAL